MRLELVASADQLQPNGDFLLAARFRIARGWHIYWSNPGDVGLATAAEFEVPQGVVTGPLQFPGPRSFVGVGGLTSYGYSDEVMISTRVRIPQRASSQSAGSDARVLRVHARWLACRDECRPGRAEATLRLLYADESAQESADTSVDRSPNRALFAAHRASLPLDGVTSRCELSLSAAGTEALVSCTNADAVEFFPAAGAEQAHKLADSERRHVQAKRQGSGAGDRESNAAVRIAIGVGEDIAKVRGVLRGESAGRSRFYAVSPADFLGSASAGFKRPDAHRPAVSARSLVSNVPSLRFRRITTSGVSRRSWATAHFLLVPCWWRASKPPLGPV